MVRGTLGRFRDKDNTKGRGTLGRFRDKDNTKVRGTLGRFRDKGKGYIGKVQRQR